MGFPTCEHTFRVYFVTTESTLKAGHRLTAVLNCQRARDQIPAFLCLNYATYYHLHAVFSRGKRTTHRFWQAHLNAINFATFLERPAIRFRFSRWIKMDSISALCVATMLANCSGFSVRVV